MVVRNGDNTPKGIAFLLTATFFFAVMNLMMKLFANKYPTSEITFFRQLFGMIPVLAMAMANGGPAALRTKHPFGHFSRAIIGNCNLLCLVLAYRYLPLADVLSLTYTQALFTAVFSALLLKEMVGPHRLGAILLGFAGVLIILNPTGTINPGAPLALFSGLLATIATIIIRQLNRTENPIAITFYFTLFGMIAMGLLCIPVFRMPAASDWALLALMGICGGLAQYTMTVAYRYAETTALAPYNYAMLVWGIGLQYLVWSDLPTQRVLAGAVLIVFSGLYILHRESRHRVNIVADSLPLENE